MNDATEEWKVPLNQGKITVTRTGDPTLRDQFAMAAMQGDLSATSGDHGLNPEAMPRFVEWCYQMADAMLKEREK